MKLRSSKELLKAEALEDQLKQSPSTSSSGVSSMAHNVDEVNKGASASHSPQPLVPTRQVPAIPYQNMSRRRIRVKPVKHQLQGSMVSLRRDKAKAVEYELYEEGLREVINSNIMTFTQKLSTSKTGGVFCVDLTENLGTFEQYGMTVFPDDTKSEQGIMKKLKKEEFRRIRLLIKLDSILREIFVSRIEIAEKLQHADLSKLSRRRAETSQATLINHYQSVSALANTVRKAGELTAELERYCLNEVEGLGEVFDTGAEQCDE